MATQTSLDLISRTPPEMSMHALSFCDGRTLSQLAQTSRKHNQLAYLTIYPEPETDCAMRALKALAEEAPYSQWGPGTSVPNSRWIERVFYPIETSDGIKTALGAQNMARKIFNHFNGKYHPMCNWSLGNVYALTLTIERSDIPKIMSLKRNAPYQNLVRVMGRKAIGAPPAQPPQSGSEPRAGV